MDIRERIAAFVAHADHLSKAHIQQAGYQHVKPNTHIADFAGKKWCKIISERDGGGRSVYAFIALCDNETKELGKIKLGDIHKPESWRKPAKHARGSIFSPNFDNCAHPHGIVYLKG